MTLQHAEFDDVEERLPDSKALAVRGWFGLKDLGTRKSAESVKMLDELWHQARARFEEAYVCALLMIEAFLDGPLVRSNDYEVVIKFIEGAHMCTQDWKTTPFRRPTYSDLYDWRVKHAPSLRVSNALTASLHDYIGMGLDIDDPNPGLLDSWVRSREELHDLIRGISLWGDADDAAAVAIAKSILAKNYDLSRFLDKHGRTDRIVLSNLIARVLAERQLDTVDPENNRVSLFLREPDKFLPRFMKKLEMGSEA